MEDPGPFIIEGHLMSLWVHKKGRSGQSWDEIRVNFGFHFNKAAPAEANVCKLGKINVPDWFCVWCKNKAEDDRNMQM